MGIGILFEATREVVAVKTGERDTQTVFFEVFTPPSEVSRRIAASADPVLTYREWILSEDSFIYEEEQFADDDIFNQHPLGKITRDPRVLHLQELDQWSDQMHRGGWDLRVVMV